MNHYYIYSQETDTVSQTKDQEISSQSADDMEVRCLTVFPKGRIFIQLNH